MVTTTFKAGDNTTATIQNVETKTTEGQYSYYSHHACQFENGRRTARRQRQRRRCGSLPMTTTTTISTMSLLVTTLFLLSLLFQDVSSFSPRRTTFLTSIQRHHRHRPVTSSPPSSSSSSFSITNPPRQISSSSSFSRFYFTALFCQLLGMNCSTPTDFTFSLQGFCQRGGNTDIHQDGWGVSFYESGGVRHFHDVEPAATSGLAHYLGSTPIRTLNMMGHIRYATVGQVDLSNVHPFCREMWGIQWCFAHNGEVPLFDNNNQWSTTTSSSSAMPVLTSLLEQDNYNADDNTLDGSSSLVSFYNPVGSTDSEATFCAILNALRNKFRTLPSMPVLYQALSTLCNEIVETDRDGTILNFLLTCGPHTQWVYSWPGSRPGSTVWNGLHYTTREYPFTTCHLRDVDYTVDFSTCTTPDDRVSVIATQPLTDDEAWTELQKGELLLFDRGEPQQSIQDLFRVELSGHGLNSTVLAKPVLEDDMKHLNVDPVEFFQGQGI